MNTATTRIPRIGPPGSADAADTAGARARAQRLCAAAEPHTDAPPCDWHIREASTQLSSGPWPHERSGALDARAGFWV